MQQSRVSKTVAALRECVNSPMPGRPRKQAGMDLLRLASEFADSLPKREADLLRKRARSYSEMIKSGFFHFMCDSARCDVIQFLRSPAGATLIKEYSETGILLPDNFRANVLQVAGWRLLLEQRPEKPGGQLLDQSPISSRDDRSEELGEAPTRKSVMYDLLEFYHPFRCNIIAQDLRGYIRRLERIEAFFRVQPSAEETSKMRQLLKSFRGLISSFNCVLNVSNCGHL
jgi:hypothetical protein